MYYVINMKEKICFKCNISKSLDFFYKHPQMPDGHLGKCKECTKKDVREREEKLRLDPEWVSKERDRHREKYHRLDYKDKHKPTKGAKVKIIKRYSEKYPEKAKIKNIISKLPKTPGFEKHHWSYRIEDALDIILLTTKDHNTAHRFLIYDQVEMRYRTVDNILLDSKETHFEYIISKL